MHALAAPGGVPLWVSDVPSGSTHDVTAARELVLPEARPYLKDLPFLADSGVVRRCSGGRHKQRIPGRAAQDTSISHRVLLR